MPQNFLSCDRDQPMLLPPDLRDWLDDDLAWFVIEAIEELDLEPFYASYCADGHGRSAHEPKMMVTTSLPAGDSVLRDRRRSSWFGSSRTKASSSFASPGAEPARGNPGSEPLVAVGPLATTKSPIPESLQCWRTRWTSRERLRFEHEARNSLREKR
jgi:hypothetical protein